MEEAMKKSILILAVLAFAMNLSAAILSCESKKGKCVYEVSADSFKKDCTCSNGHGISEAELASEGIKIESVLPSDDECEAEIERVCMQG